MLKVDRDAERAHELLEQTDVKEAMRIRCEEEGHSWENACSPTLQIYQVCKWCGGRR
jgi:hypothetical protein